tara:strand:- start:16720 stop:17253 length:534 start_codon:yes stop_codon:yes gene_type:complete
MNSEDRALKAILEGKPVVKPIMVGYEGKKQKPGDQKSRLTDIMADARMPWFCPKCDKVMKKKLDNKMWMFYGHCFDCQVDFEHDLRVTGKFEEWQSNKVLKNKKSIILEQIQSIEDWQKQGDLQVVEPVNPESGAVHIETYETDKATKQLAKDALKDLNNALKSINDTIEKFDAQRQ